MVHHLTILLDNVTGLFAKKKLVLITCPLPYCVIKNPKLVFSIFYIRLLQFYSSNTKAPSNMA